MRRGARVDIVEMARIGNGLLRRILREVMGREYGIVGVSLEAEDDASEREFDREGGASGTRTRLGTLAGGRDKDKLGTGGWLKAFVYVLRTVGESVATVKLKPVFDLRAKLKGSDAVCRDSFGRLAPGEAVPIGDKVRALMVEAVDCEFAEMESVGGCCLTSATTEPPSSFVWQSIYSDGGRIGRANIMNARNCV